MELILFVILLLVIAIYMKLGSLEKKIEILYDEVLYQSSKDATKLEEASSIVADKEDVTTQEVVTEAYKDANKEVALEVTDSKPTKIELTKEPVQEPIQEAVESLDNKTSYVTKEQDKLFNEAMNRYKEERADKISEKNSAVVEPNELNANESRTQDVEPQATNNFLASLFSMDNILVKLGAVVLFFGLAFWQNMQ